MYSIKKKSLCRLQQLFKQGKLPQDQRGKQQNQKIIPVDVILQVKNPIEPFPYFASKEYNLLSAELNIKKIFITFKTLHPETKTLKTSRANFIREILLLWRVNQEVNPRSVKQHFLVSNFIEFEYSSNIKALVVTSPFIENVEENKTQTVTLPTENAYYGPVLLKINKMEDLKRTMQYISAEHKAFYENIIENWPKY
ncbi:hypothetical protein WA026_012981 [Henosepilachna vigintioctopunctata]|uniref:Uncharacterized protein n=1 Tax=Henosepilachna vigintioctopunctata TaxID=420089 RepID=A0AAW1TK91_9CUCU